MVSVKWVAALLALGAAGYAGWWYLSYRNHNGKKPYKIEKPKVRTLRRTVDATGLVNIEEEYKIGALVTGTIQKLLVEQNQQVKKGDILAIIDNGKGDSDVRAEEGALAQIEANLAYRTTHFDRIEKLHQTGYVSDDAFELERASLQELRGKQITAKANLERARIDWENTKVKSPEDGVVASIGVKEGLAITTLFDATVLFVVAHDLTKMEVVLDIDEGDVGDVKEGQKINLTFDCYGDRIFESKINTLSYGSFKKNGGVTFEAKGVVDNKELLLRPGMTTSGEIMITEAENVLTISSQALLIPRAAIRDAAKIIGYTVQEVSLAKGEKSVWVVDKNSFVEHKLKLGITDETHYEVLGGVTADDEILVDVEEKDQLEALYKKMMKRI